MSVGAHFGSIPIGRVEIDIDEPRVRWFREHGTLLFPTPAPKAISQCWVPQAVCAPS